MNSYDVPIVEPTIDYTKVPPINQKRTISFVNHFIVHTVTFLNKFALFCEEKLFEFENKLQKVEASLEILESRLSSIPGLEHESQSKIVSVDQTSNDATESELAHIEEHDDAISNDTVDNESKEYSQPPLKYDPAHEKYLKMVRFGVPKEAVKLKMKQEGLDSSVLDNPQ